MCSMPCCVNICIVYGCGCGCVFPISTKDSPKTRDALLKQTEAALML
jgi:hypothetical protein